MPIEKKYNKDDIRRGKQFRNSKCMMTCYGYDVIWDFPVFLMTSYQQQQLIGMRKHKSVVNAQ